MSEKQAAKKPQGGQQAAGGKAKQQDPKGKGKAPATNAQGSPKPAAGNGQAKGGAKGKAPQQEAKGKGKAPASSSSSSAAQPAAAAAAPASTEARATSPRAQQPAGAQQGQQAAQAKPKKVKVEKEKGSGIVKAVLSGDRLEVYVDETAKRTTWVPPPTKELKLSNIKAPLPYAKGEWGVRQEEVRMHTSSHLILLHEHHSYEFYHLLNGQPPSLYSNFNAGILYTNFCSHKGQLV